MLLWDADGDEAVPEAEDEEAEASVDDDDEEEDLVRREVQRPMISAARQRMIRTIEYYETVSAALEKQIIRD